MARITRLPVQIYEYDFVNLARKEQHACTRERLLGMAHLQSHGSLTKTAAALFVAITTVQNWLNRFRRDGLAGLQEKSRPGRPCKLTKEQLLKLEFLLEEWTLNQSGGRLKGKDIQLKICETFGVHYHLNALYRLLKKQNWSWITVRSLHPKSNNEAQQGFKKLLK
jgi:transposase